MKSSRSRLLAALLALVAAVAAVAPSSGISFGDLLKKAAQRGSKKPTSRSTAAVRGWDSESAAGDSERRNFADLEWLERIEIDDDDLRRFVKEGGLAP